MNLLRCSIHRDEYFDAETSCPRCVDDVERAHPDFAPVIRRARRWQAVHVAYGVAVGVLVTVAWYAFLVYREWVIWTR